MIEPFFRALRLGRRLLPAAGIAVLVTPAVIHAQPSPATSPAFEVTSVKPNQSGDMRNMRMQALPGGKFVATHLPVRMLIVIAYNLPFQSMRLSGGPDWIDSEGFDIEATAEKGATPMDLSEADREERMRLMLRALLADRFKLAIRRETKELQVYALVVGKNGSKLQKAIIEEKDCPEAGAGGVSCHSFMGGMGRGLHGKAVNMTDLAKFIENWTDHPVVDSTGISGLFSIETEGWTPMRGPPPKPAEAPPPGTPPSGDGDMADPTRPTLFMVLEKLGLGLKHDKGLVDAYVIEHVERPTEN